LQSKLTMKNLLKSLALAGITAASFGCSPTQTTTFTAVHPDSSFNAFKQNFVEELWQLDPSWAVSAGRHDYDSLLTLPSAEQRQKAQSKFKNVQDSLHSYDLASLSGGNQIDYKLIDNYINRSAWYNDEFKIYQWNPATYNVGSEFAIILNGRYAPLDTRLTALLHKLQYVPVYYEAAQANINKPTIQHTDLAIAQSKGAQNVFGQAMADSVAKSGLSAAQKELFNQRRTEAISAIQSYIGFLTDLRKGLTPETARSFRIGKEHFSKKFELDIVSVNSAEEIYNKALSRKKELHGKMTQLARELWPKYMGKASTPADSLLMIRQVIDKISLSHTHRDSFLVEIEKQIPELIAFVNEKDLLTQDPSKPLVVRRTPEYMDGVAGASISAPGPYDKNADTYYNVSTLEDYTPAEAESYLREYNDYILQILNIHEAIPGHYTQLVHANKSPSIIKSIFRNGAMIEGWAVYTEQMMLEAGYKNSPEMWLMYYKWNMRVTMNTVLDYSVHVLNISERDALNMLMREAFQENAEATGKWKRATLSQVQLCSYFTGFQEIVDLREELKKQQGEDFNLKAFHEEFLSYGSAPVKFIRELMLKKKA
jgi:uncharacterized protein (DUF885 family)